MTQHTSFYTDTTYFTWFCTSTSHFSSIHSAVTQHTQNSFCSNTFNTLQRHNPLQIIVLWYNTLQFIPHSYRLKHISIYSAVTKQFTSICNHTFHFTLQSYNTFQLTPQSTIIHCTGFLQHNSILFLITKFHLILRWHNLLHTTLQS